MATNIQRTVAICDALVNGTSTAAQQTLLAKALYGIGLGKPPFEELTNAEKAAIIPAAIRGWALSMIHSYNQAEATRVAMTNLPDPAATLPEA